MWSKFREKFIGDKAFYRRVLLIAMPMIGRMQLPAL